MHFDNNDNKLSRRFGVTIEMTQSKIKIEKEQVRIHEAFNDSVTFKDPPTHLYIKQRKQRVIRKVTASPVYSFLYSLNESPCSYVYIRVLKQSPMGPARAPERLLTSLQ